MFLRLYVVLAGLGLRVLSASDTCGGPFLCNFSILRFFYVRIQEVEKFNHSADFHCNSSGNLRASIITSAASSLCSFILLAIAFTLFTSF